MPELPIDDPNPYTDDERSALTSDWSDDRSTYGWTIPQASYIYEQGWGRGRDHERRRWLDGTEPNRAADAAQAQSPGAVTFQEHLLQAKAPIDGWIAYHNGHHGLVANLGDDYVAKLRIALDARVDSDYPEADVYQDFLRLLDGVLDNDPINPSDFIVVERADARMVDQSVRALEEENARLRLQLATERATTAGLQGLIDQERAEHEATIAELQNDEAKEEGVLTAAGGWAAPTEQVYPLTFGLGATQEPRHRSELLLENFEAIDEQINDLRQEQAEIAKEIVREQIAERRSNRG